MCEICHERKAVKKALLSDGRTLRLCFECLADVASPSAVEENGAVSAAAAAAAAMPSRISPSVDPRQRMTEAQSARRPSAPVTSGNGASASSSANEKPASLQSSSSARSISKPSFIVDSSSSASSPVFVVRAAFQATQKGQLTLAKGDLLKVYSQEKKDWWKAINVQGQKGWVKTRAFCFVSGLFVNKLIYYYYRRQLNISHWQTHSRFKNMKQVFA